MGQHIRAFFGRPPRMGFGPCGSFRLTTFSRMRTNDAKRGTWQANIGTLRVARSLFHMLHALRHALTRVGESTTHPAAFAVVAAYAAAWLFFSPDTFGWAAIATLATWLMTFSSTARSTVTPRRFTPRSTNYFVPKARPEPSSPRWMSAM